MPSYVRSVHSKTCTKCGVDKPVSKFASRTDRPGHHKSRCKACTSKDNRKYPASAESKRAYDAKRPRRPQSAQKLAMLQLPDDAHTIWLKKLVKTKRRKHKGTLDVSWIAKWSAVQYCPVLGMPFLPSGTKLNGSPHPLTPSLDQITPGGGYTPENTRVVSYFVNVSKNAWPEDQYRLLTMAAAANMRH